MLPQPPERELTSEEIAGNMPQARLHAPTWLVFMMAFAPGILFAGLTFAYRFLLSLHNFHELGIELLILCFITQLIGIFLFAYLFTRIDLEITMAAPEKKKSLTRTRIISYSLSQLILTPLIGLLTVAIIFPIIGW